MSFKKIAWVPALAMALVLVSSHAAPTVAQEDNFGGMIPAPDRRSDEGVGPYDRLIIRGVTVIDGTGGPPMGPVDVVVEGNRITRVQGVGYPGLPIDEERRPGEADYEVDAEGMYLLPGFIDLHTHTGGAGKAPEAEYTYKLWMGNGITTSRGVGHGTFEFSLNERERSEANAIVAPRMISYVRPGSGVDYQGPRVDDADSAREWVQYASMKGADGLKLGAYPPDIMEALIDESHKQGMGTTAHLAQTGVGTMNALDAARVGLDSMTHYYGLFEAMYDDYSVQPYPVDHNYSNEQHRFGQVARQWDMVTPGSDKWNAVMQEMLDLDFYLNPTMTIYSAGRDVMRARNAEWHEEYTLPSAVGLLPAEPQVPTAPTGSTGPPGTRSPGRTSTTSGCSFSTTTRTRVARSLPVPTRASSIKLYGFGYILELELLQEAGFHPLEVHPRGNHALGDGDQQTASRGRQDQDRRRSVRATSPTWSSLTRIRWKT